MKKLIFVLSLAFVSLVGFGQLDTLNTVGGGAFGGGGDSKKVAYEKINDAIIGVNEQFSMARTTSTASGYEDMITSEWTQGDTTTGGTNGIYSIINPIYNIQNAYGLRARVDCRDATADTVHVNQLHAIDALINLDETKDYGVVDNMSAIGVAIHGGHAGGVVDEGTGGGVASLNLFYGVWGPTATHNQDATTNGVVIVTHAQTDVDYGFNFTNSGASSAGLLLNNHASNSPATMTAGIEMVSAASKMTYGIDMSAAGITGAEILCQNGATIDNVDADTLTFTETNFSFLGAIFMEGAEVSDFAISDEQVPLLEYWAKTQELNRLPAFENANRDNINVYISGVEETAERLLRYVVELEARISELEGKLEE